MKHTLIILAHGSRRARSNEEVAQLASRLGSRLKDFNSVQHAYLEMLSPTLPEAAAAAIDAGAEAVSVYPFFLNSGNHVERDVPELIETLRKQYADVDFQLLRHLGSAEKMDELVVEHIENQKA